MDPISAAGIGLSVTSLTAQIFAGCIKAYHIFSDAANVPTYYQYLLTRLRIEQTRLLNWGEHFGLLEISLEESSAKLGWNHNIVNDVLLEIQAAFRGCVTIQAEYSSFAKHSTAHSPPPQRNRHSGSARKAFLERVLAIPDVSSRATARLQWAMIKKDAFEDLINKLIALNDRIESILDRDALGEIRAMQAQSNLMLLQVTDKVTQLRVLIEALNITRQPQRCDAYLTSSPFRPIPAGVDIESTSTVASLAEFKAEAMLVDMNIAQQAPKCIDLADIALECSSGHSDVFRHKKVRSTGQYQQRHVWLEWRENVDETRLSSEIQEQIHTRVKQLTALLCNKNKSPLFRSPICLGYVRDDSDEMPRYALVYDFEAPSRSKDATLRTLREALTSQQVPSLGKRIALACAIAESLFYLHTVSWLHKDIKSDNIIFIRQHSGETPEDGKEVADISSPILSGFDCSRPDLVDEYSFRYSTMVANELYRHPDLLQLKTQRYQKSHDMYSLGLVLIEIALWQPIEAIVGIQVRQSHLLEISKKLARLDDKDDALRLRLAAQVGDGFADVVSRCVAGAEGIDASSGSEETDPDVRARMQEVFFDEVVKRLQDYRL